MESMVSNLASRVAVIGWAIGFLLIFVGTLVAVILFDPASCINNSGTPPGCTTSNLQTFYTGLFVGKILWAIGLAFIGGSSGVRLHWGTPRPGAGATNQDIHWAFSERWLNLVAVIVSIVLLFLLLVPTAVSVTALG